MKKHFEIEMNWRRVLLLSVASAVVTALLNCIPTLARTSFAAPAETLELWVVLAVLIIMNCSNVKEAMLKTFVFFLISQPLIYLIEVPFKEAGWSLFQYYPFWGVITVLTIPGAALAFRVKKGDILSAVILSVANFLLLLNGLSRISIVVYEFPRYLITLIFCLFFPFWFIVSLLKEKKSRIIAFLLAIAMILALICMYVVFPRDSTLSYLVEEGNWKLESVSPSGLQVQVGEDDMTLKSHMNGEYTVILEDESGRKLCYDVTVSGGDHYIAVEKPYSID